MRNLGDRSEVARQRLGAEVRRLRKAAGLTQAALANRAGYSRVYVTLVETGRDNPGEDFIHRLVKVLDGGGALLELYDRLRSERATQAEGTADAMNRREILRGLGTVALSATVSAASPLTSGIVGSGTTDLAPIEHFREMRKVLVDSDNLFGPEQVIPATIRQVRILQRLRQTARGADGRGLLHMQTQFAEFAAWLHQDKGEHDTAQWWTDRALEWSHIALDPALTAFVLARKSQLAGDMQDSITAIQVAEAAVSMAPSGTRLAAVATTYAAHGYALAGDAAASSLGYDHAHDLLATTDVDPQSTWGVWLDGSYIEVQRARSLATLGNYSSAATGYEQAIAELPDGYPRDRGVYLAGAALAHAGARNVDQAATLGMQALAIATGTGSGRIINRLHRLESMLTTSGTSEAHEFQDAFRSVASSN